MLGRNTKVKLQRLNPLQRKRINEHKIRENLALDRTILANERTILSYIRTSLYLLIGGIALLGHRDFADLRWLGVVSLVLCVSLLAIGIVRFVILRRRLYKYFADMNRSMKKPEA